MKDVWGDLERSITVVQPKKLDPPASLKVTLLPFQQESLYWMKEQEKGPWKGGMLAVSADPYPGPVLSNAMPIKDEMGSVIYVEGALRVLTPLQNGKDDTNDITSGVRCGH